jgi:hypothetical protein
MVTDGIVGVYGQLIAHIPAKVSGPTLRIGLCQVARIFTLKTGNVPGAAVELTKFAI